MNCTKVGSEQDFPYKYNLPTSGLDLLSKWSRDPLSPPPQDRKGNRFPWLQLQEGQNGRDFLDFLQDWVGGEPHRNSKEMPGPSSELQVCLGLSMSKSVLFLVTVFLPAPRFSDNIIILNPEYFCTMTSSQSLHCEDTEGKDLCG